VRCAAKKPGFEPSAQLEFPDFGYSLPHASPEKMCYKDYWKNLNQGLSCLLHSHVQLRRSVVNLVAWHAPARSCSVQCSPQIHLRSFASGSDCSKYFRYVDYLTKPRTTVHVHRGHQKVPSYGSKSTRIVIDQALRPPLHLLLLHHQTSQDHQGFDF